MLIALVYYENVVGPCVGGFEQAFGRPYCARRVVWVAQPVSLSSAYGAPVGRRSAPVHAAGVGIFAERRAAYNVCEAVAAEAFGQVMRYGVYGLSGAVCGRHLVCANPTFVGQGAFEPQRCRFGVAAYQVEPFGQVPFQRAEVGMLVDVRAEVSPNHTVISV